MADIEHDKVIALSDAFGALCQAWMPLSVSSIFIAFFVDDDVELSKRFGSLFFVLFVRVVIEIPFVDAQRAYRDLL